MDRVFVLVAASVIMYFLAGVSPEQCAVPGADSVLSLGFLVLAAYLMAGLLKRFKLPLITGYILAGVLFGPSLLGFLSDDIVGDLKLVDDLALTFIAFAAGGELRLDMLKDRKRSILFTLVCLIVIVMVGVTLSVLALRDFFPFSAGRPFMQGLAIAALCGVIAVARSPSSAIAIISETKARGPFTEMVLGVTVAADVLTIFLFAMVLSFAQLVMSSGESLDFSFLLVMVGEVVGSVVIGLVLGAGMVCYLKKVGTDLTIFVLGVAFLVTKFSNGLAAFLHAEYGAHFNLEPMIICLAAGFLVRNFSEPGETFIRVIDRSSLPIYAIFFAMSGASLSLTALRDTWHWALILVALRGGFIYISTFLGGRLAGDPPRFRKASGFGFLTQAGVSLGLAKLVAERFPEFGTDLATLMVATVAINQIIGPIGFKQSLSYVGETREARIAARLDGAREGG